MTSTLDPPRLTRRTRSSFTTTDVQSVATLLEQQGYIAVRPKSDREAARLVKAGAIAVLYASGTVLIQGSDPAPLRALLDQAAAEVQPALFDMAGVSL